MNMSAFPTKSTLAPAWLLLVLIMSLPLMKPAPAYPIVLADLVFLFVVAALAVELIALRISIRWGASFAILFAYLLSLVPSLLVSPDAVQSGVKVATTAYLVMLAAVTIIVVDEEAMLKRAVMAWLAVTAGLVFLALASLAAFVIAPDSWLYGYSRFHFGTLPPGHYPRLSLTFLNANLACNYLTVSMGLLFLARQEGWIAGRWAALLLAGIVVAAASTLSPGLGGVALALGIGWWTRSGSRLPLFISAAVAAGFVLAAAFTPLIHPTAPYVLTVSGAGIVLAPSGRLMIWTAALQEFLRYPLLGHGMGIDPVSLHYLAPSGEMQWLRDAHNVILSIAAQAGLIGLVGLAMLLAHAVRLCRSNSVALILGLTFLNGFLYQGLTGAFEDTRHLWILFGLLVAAARLPISHRDGNSRTIAAPLPG